ncbi:diacylglycerol kinase family protein [Spirochaeta isovalerica]|uniref:Diacylglycerol kinase n=1 Tax=Spirochaeta isovalerica TaxID=150 RepID=A0A841R9X1_9SPIO|nr:diacylglycerol kinase family protein [Spirochaeta isovalerica]MBB6482164.1 diacylglycerol kinase [Spirochaeta isovalerica]
MNIFDHITRKFGYAFKGLKIAIITDNSFKIHFLFAFPVVLSGFFLHFNRYEWMAIVLSIGLVLVAELFNTSIEYLVKMFTDEYHELAEKLLDISAGAVLMAAIMALVMAAFVYYPYVI